MIRRSLRIFGVVTFALTLLVGAEIWLALRREYLPTEPALELGGSFGPPRGDEVVLVVLGDSTAAGLGAGSPDGAYATVLAERLALELDRPVRLHALGMSGARVRDVLEEQAPRASSLQPDVVFVGIGANDVTHLTPLARIEEDMSSVVSELKASGAEVVVAGAPDMRAKAWLPPLRQLAGWRGRQVAEAVEEAGRENGAHVVELAEETGHFFAADPEAHFSEDDFHPSALGYKRWADAIFPVVLEALRG